MKFLDDGGWAFFTMGVIVGELLVIVLQKISGHLP